MPIAIGQVLESDFRNPLGMLSDCHRRIARFLETLISVAEQSHGGALSDNQRQGLEASIKYFRESAPKHTADEEDSLFPRLRRRTADTGKRMALLTMLHSDHVAVVWQHDAVDQLVQHWLRDNRLPDVAAKRLIELLHGLRNTYQEHIEMEETRLFPFAAKMLTSGDLSEIGSEMAQRRGLAPLRPHNT
jgi:hemerythrin-like domain-containing protein